MKTSWPWRSTRTGSDLCRPGNEPQLRWWNLDGDKPSARRGGHAGPVQQLAFSGDGRRLISAGGDRSVRLWDGKTGAADPLIARPGEWQYAADPLGRRQTGRGGGLGRTRATLGRRDRPPARHPRPAADRLTVSQGDPGRWADLAGHHARRPCRGLKRALAVGDLAGGRRRSGRPRPPAPSAFLRRSSLGPCAEKPSSPSNFRPGRGTEP